MWMGVLEVCSVGSCTAGPPATGIKSVIEYVMPVVNLGNSLGAAAPNLGYLLSEMSLDVQH